MTDSRTVVLLIRHGHTEAVGTQLVGRLPGVSLSLIGRAEVERLRDALSGERIDALYSSPLERTMETAEALGIDRGLPVHRRECLIEVDFGEWTGKTFAELDGRADWQAFNTRRSAAVVPGGESAPAVQARIVSCLQELHARHPAETIAVVSHADVIRAALLHYAGRSLDDWQQLEILPASISAIRFDGTRGDILYTNQQRTATSATPRSISR